MEQDVTFTVVTSALTRAQKLFSHVGESLPYRSGRAIRDPDVVAFIEKLETRNTLLSAVENTHVRTDFLSAFPEWLRSSKTNQVKNLDALRYVSFSSGTIQAFDAFYAEHRQ